MSVRVAVIYYSSTGTNYELARAAAEAAENLGAEVRLRRVRETAPPEAVASRPEWQAHLEATKDVPEASLDDLDWADTFVFSSPTRFGNVASQLRAFVDTAGGLWAQGKLTNKVATLMTSAQNDHGGQESTLLTFYVTLAHWGTILVPPGYTDQTIFAAGGNPYGTSVTATGGNVPENVLEAARYQARRAVEVTMWLKAGQEVRQRETAGLEATATDAAGGDYVTH